jgi:uncharacterized protein
VKVRSKVIYAGGARPTVPEFRYINWAEYGDLADALAEKVRLGGVKFDVIIGIARGGIPVAMVVSDHLAVAIDFINVKSYTGIAERKEPRILSTLTDEIAEKNVLVVDDLVDQGDTMKTVCAFLAQKKPKKLMTAVLFKKPWTKTGPDFYLDEVEHWIVFPWEHGEVNRMRVANGEVLHGRA